MSYSSTVETARTYYNSDDADNFYATIWGGEDIHIGIYENEADSIFDASQRTVQKIASMLNLDKSKRVLDIGAGYGGTARYLAKTFGCTVICLNLSEVQNQRNKQLNKEQGLSKLVKVLNGNFEDIPLETRECDAVVSQDAILHSGNRSQVFKEVARVLKPSGDFIFTDPMQSDNCPEGVLQPVLDRIHLDSMGSFKFYIDTAVEEAGFENMNVVEMTKQLTNHYSHVLREVEVRNDEILKVCSQDYIDRMKVGLNHWIEAGKKGYLAWGIMHFRKKVLS